MQVLTVISQKGGTGKTTLCGHLAVQAELAGNGPVALVDTDPQGSLSKWWNEREGSAPALSQTTAAHLQTELGNLKQQGFKLAIIDTPPAITPAIQAVISVSDLIIIPTRPSPHDVKTMGSTVDLADRSDKSFVFVINEAHPKEGITSDTAITLSQYGTVSPSIIHQRANFATSMVDGRTVMECTPDSESTREIEALWDYVNTRMEKIHKRAIFQHNPSTPRSFDRRQNPDRRQSSDRRLVSVMPPTRGGFGRRKSDKNIAKD